MRLDREPQLGGSPGPAPRGSRRGREAAPPPLRAPPTRSRGSSYLTDPRGSQRQGSGPRGPGTFPPRGAAAPATPAPATPVPAAPVPAAPVPGTGAAPGLCPPPTAAGRGDGDGGAGPGPAPLAASGREVLVTAESFAPAVRRRPGARRSAGLPPVLPGRAGVSCSPRPPPQPRAGGARAGGPAGAGSGALRGRASGRGSLGHERVKVSIIQ